eukprot:m.17257 g.17257  ORF g.17257 m.17257 type:complete len:101 (-) comp10663_c0_seq1:379-681(-)
MSHSSNNSSHKNNITNLNNSKGKTHVNLKWINSFSALKAAVTSAFVNPLASNSSNAVFNTVFNKKSISRWLYPCSIHFVWQTLLKAIRKISVKDQFEKIV